MSTTQSKQNFTAVSIIAIIALLGLNGYQWYSNSKLSQANQQLQTQQIELEKVQAELDQDYQTALESLEEMRGDNQQLNALIDSQKAELKAQKEKINDLIWTKRELDKAKEEIKALKANVNKYLDEIKTLKEENKLLAEDNQKLNQRIDAEVREKEEILSQKESLASEKERLSKTNENLGAKVDIASAVKVNTIIVKGYEIKKDGKLKEQSKAKNIDMLRVCFQTETNRVTSAGTKRFYLRIINPQGETIAVEDKGSGVLTNKLDNTQVRYTTSGEIQYNNEDTNACIDWTLDDKLPKGNYNIEMYNNGYPVGKGAFVMK
jgi:predicted RNase H-like nuclease (RuvC/YqgF family)